MTDVNDKFGGDYTKAVEAYNALETKLGQQATQINELTQQINTNNQTIQTLQNAQSQSDTDSGSGGSLYDWANGKMRADDGSIDSGLLSAMEKLGATREQTTALVENVEYAQQVVQEQTAQNISSRFGNQQNFDAALTWAKDNLDPSKQSAINALLGNRSTAAHGMEMLKTEAAAGGLVFEQKTQAKVDEPTHLPENTGVGAGGPTPLKPNTPEAIEAMKEAFASNDPAKVAEYEARLLAGQRAS